MTYSSWKSMRLDSSMYSDFRASSSQRARSSVESSARRPPSEAAFPMERISPLGSEGKRPMDSALSVLM